MDPRCSCCQKSTPPRDARAGYFNSVHGSAIDAQTRHIFVNDRGNHRIQVFDENGKYLYEGHVGDQRFDVHLIYIGADRSLWAFDRGTSKMLKYGLRGPLALYLGPWDDFPVGFKTLVAIPLRSPAKKALA